MTHTIVPNEPTEAELLACPVCKEKIIEIVTIVYPLKLRGKSQWRCGLCHERGPLCDDVGAASPKPGHNDAVKALVRAAQSSQAIARRKDGGRTVDECSQDLMLIDDILRAALRPFMKEHE